ncbi:hypothetical protein [Caulobacter mirabilis]|uniref:hypothetical protein n=1 Tax=Caulobacter mirabilis TaxID=69666 RepID=UPI0012376679|nr:hypothetical protein [Caulobacter mirabilis]
MQRHPRPCAPDGRARLQAKLGQARSRLVLVAIYLALVAAMLVAAPRARAAVAAELSPASGQ